LIDAYPELQIIATGSSSFELANSISEPLTGLKFEFMLYPLSISEVIKDSNRQEIQRKLDDFMRFGLYPEIYSEQYNNVDRRLSELAGSYLFKDIYKYEDT